MIYSSFSAKFNDKMCIIQQKDSSHLTSFTCSTSSRKNFTVHRYAECTLLSWNVVKKNIFEWRQVDISTKKRHYILFHKNITLHFPVYCKFLPNSTRSNAEIFTANRTFCFIHSLKMWAKSDKSLKSYKWDNLQKSSLYISFVENVTLHFSGYCKFLLKGTKSKAEIFTTNRTSCFIPAIKIWAKFDNSLKSYKADNFQIVTLQSE